MQIIWLPFYLLFFYKIALRNLSYEIKLHLRQLISWIPLRKGTIALYPLHLLKYLSNPLLCLLLMFQILPQVGNIDYHHIHCEEHKRYTFHQLISVHLKSYGIWLLLAGNWLIHQLWQSFGSHLHQLGLPASSRMASR